METTNELQILIADDHKIIRDGLKAVLKDVEGINIVAEADNGREAIGWLNSPTHIDMVLMDINMPLMDGVEATAFITEKMPHVKVLALSMHHDEAHITKILKAGARGYVMKNSGREELVKAILTVLSGNSYFSEDISQILLSKYMAPSTNPIEKKFTVDIKLTNREIEIIALIGKELTNKEIGDKLFISPRTVDTHRRNLMQKLGVKNSVGLIKYALNMGWVEA